MKIAYGIAPILLSLTFGIDRAAAAPRSEADPLSPYIGQCVALITTSELALPGILQAVDEHSVEIDLTGYPAVIYRSHVMAALADPAGTSGACVLGEDTARMLQSMGLTGAATDDR